jgi:hypothetical protein
MHLFVTLIVKGDQYAFAELECLFCKESKSLGLGSSHALGQGTDNNLDGVLAESVKAQLIPGKPELTISADLFVTVPASPFRDFGVKSFSAANDGSEDPQHSPLSQFIPEPGKELIPRLSFDGKITVRAVSGAETAEEQAQEVVDFRDCGDGAFATSARVALLKADGGWDSDYSIDIGPRELLDELPGVGVHRIEKAPLALRKQQIKGKRAFARATHAGDHNEAAARDLERDVLEVVFARAMDADGVGEGKLLLGTA